MSKKPAKPTLSIHTQRLRRAEKDFGARVDALETVLGQVAQQVGIEQGRFQQMLDTALTKSRRGVS